MAEWRVGRSTGRTLWRDEQLVGMVDSPEVAAEIVGAMRAVARLLGDEPESVRERSLRREVWTIPGYAHDAHCNAIHRAGPQPCPPPHDHRPGEQCGECEWPAGIGYPT